MKTKKQIISEIEFGDVYTSAQFLHAVEDDSFNSFDGIGFFHDGDKETDLCVWDRKVTKETFLKYPFVIWYNK